ncbi:thiol:disulfide interchange protein [Polaribacter reichenbachii]|uniref:Thiol:disulfide interchange protein n=1 Tax=Polaribacter reichenbachii TaxID=996801 RepID=A0A1B8TRF6_9FLAO|nr:DUF4369 domain-containing protein [Polaribacter reichenbachii]APZ47758.1 thiol:disulfide interchange protein [Polaribacter reichenbachii]AUC18393.1 thiol:disulfide interchange protein [Polaribacter reichenbachii]OBY62257.1 thiol:disulfide interchange protein [Polaribacter reichenbachii]
MKKFITVLSLSIILFACSSKKEGNMIVQGQIKGLKKGKLYLQKMVDTVLVSVDSIALLGADTFKLTDNVDSPVLYYLTFDGNTTDKRILFFGEKGTITINDKVDNFGSFPNISGSKNQEILDRYNVVRKKFQNKRLDFIKKDFDAKRAKDEDLIKQLEVDYKRLVKRRVLYTTNFAITNSDSEVAPYLGLTEMYDASLQMLDTVNNTLSPRVKESDYGKRFQEYLNKIKAANKE